MMNEATNPSRLLVFASFLMFFAMLAVFCFIDGFMKTILEKLPYLIAVFTAVTATFSGYGLSRLNTFDKLDDLQERDTALIYNQVNVFRSLLESIIPFSLLSAFGVLIIGLVANAKPVIDLFFTIDMQIVFAMFVSGVIGIHFLLVICMTRIFKVITELKNQVFTLTQIEKKRKEILAQLYEQAERDPLSDMDFHFRKFKNILDK